MADETKKLFEKLIDKTCYDSMYKAMSEHISDNYGNLDLAERSSIIEKVHDASLDDMEIKRVDNIEQDDDAVKFEVIVSCEIEIEETVRRDRQVDSASQWFTLSCNAVLDGALKYFKVRAIEVYCR